MMADFQTTFIWEWLCRFAIPTVIETKTKAAMDAAAALKPKEKIDATTGGAQE